MTLRFRAALFAFLCAAGAWLPARVLRVEVASRADVAGGQAFGPAGAYERVTGKVFFSVAVSNPRNRAIVDLALAENLQNGEVAFAADFVAVRPKDPSRGNGTLVLESPNRGRVRIVGLVDAGDPDPVKDAGDGWLLRQGFSIVTLGWQWDAAGPGALRLEAPVARDRGRAITGLVRGDLMPSKATADIPLGHLILGNLGGSEYPVSDPDDPRNTLTVRDAPDAPRIPVLRDQWSFARLVDGRLQPSDRHIHLEGGFQPGRIYEYVYVAKDPVVAGLGLAAFRDFASWCKHGRGRLVPVARVIGQGISQNGRFLRHFLHQGFNADERGRRALDGVLAHVAGAGRGSFNHRFAQPSRDAQPTSSIHFPTDLFPFTDAPQRDPQDGRRAGLLDRARVDRVVPRIFFSNTSYEYWGRAASLIHTSADGLADAASAPEVRIYHFAGLQHFSGPFPPARGAGDLLGQAPQSPLPVRFFWRAMIAAMDAWLRHGSAPPPSAHPRLADGSLVPLEKYAFPLLPGVRVPAEASDAPRLDLGPGWRRGILDRQPPKAGASYPVRVPQVDADGNETAGVRLPQITVPLATYAAWNLRDPSIGAPGRRVAFEGSCLPFPRTREDRLARADPRPSIAERYRGREDYLARYAKAVDELVKQRWILAEDREALLRRGGQEWEEATRNPAPR